MKTEFSIRDHTSAMADVVSGVIPRPQTWGQWRAHNMGTLMQEWFSQTPAGVNIGGENVLMVGVQATYRFQAHDSLFAAMEAGFVWLAFVGDRVLALNEDGTFSADLTDALRDVWAKLLFWAFTWRSDGQGGGTYRDINGKIVTYSD